MTSWESQTWKGKRNQSPSLGSESIQFSKQKKPRFMKTDSSGDSDEKLTRLFDQNMSIKQRERYLMVRHQDGESNIKEYVGTWEEVLPQIYADNFDPDIFRMTFLVDGEWKYERRFMRALRKYQSEISSEKFSDRIQKIEHQRNSLAEFGEEYGLMYEFDVNDVKKLLEKDKRYSEISRISDLYENEDLFIQFLAENGLLQKVFKLKDSDFYWNELMDILSFSNEYSGIFVKNPDQTYKRIVNPDGSTFLKKRNEDSDEMEED